MSISERITIVGVAILGILAIAVCPEDATAGVLFLLISMPALIGQAFCDIRRLLRVVVDYCRNTVR